MIEHDRVKEDVLFTNDRRVGHHGVVKMPPDDDFIEDCLFKLEAATVFCGNCLNVSDALQHALTQREQSTHLLLSIVGY